MTFDRTGRTPGRIPKREARRRTLERLRTWRSYVFVLGGEAAAVAVALAWRALTDLLGPAPGPTAFGMMLGALTASIPWAAWVAVTAVDGSSSSRQGATGEEWTAEELDKLGPDWVTIHGVPFEHGGGQHQREVDVDHVVIGPGGVWVIETKFRGGKLDLGEQRVHPQVKAYVKQAAANAGRVRGLLQSRLGAIDVHALVLVWGPDGEAPAEGTRSIEGVLVARGTDGDRWRPALHRDDLPASARDLARDRVLNYMDRRVRIERSSPEWQAEAARRINRSRRLAMISVLWTLAATVVIASAYPFSWWEKVLSKVLGTGGGFGAFLLLCTPLIAGLAALADAAHQRRRAGDGDLRRPIGALAGWAILFCGLLIAT